ncbi:hypothetical protein GlitD10_1453 [Gloeomargarita lithophora Alchichica-D10]|uniref:Uncharacterized protein n=1 Tax=Gloeomargarita lithophora Alchichica-D10 TaxID=1188229 RepID=A0A1J0ACY9_9CYAN|nr:hypothetical protein GlitD10_1453 [Gloeomargarita lithophora Alchichica-D10]
MPFNLLLLPLLGGYIFSTFSNRTKWEVKRYEGQRLILYVSFWGTFFLFVSIILLNIPVLGDNFILSFKFLFKNFNVNRLNNLTEEQFAVSVLAFLLGAIAK